VLCCAAVGGICVHAQSGSVQAAQLGLGAGALLGLSAVAMSDMRDSELGELGVKAAWGECLGSNGREGFACVLCVWPAGGGFPTCYSTGTGLGCVLCLQGASDGLKGTAPKYWYQG
jgi:hypothetical protein